ncbi:hypothetical protein OXX80_004295 [Metschnikowia pulcherrima]
MSMNSHVRSYIYQHSLSLSNDAERDLQDPNLSQKRAYTLDKPLSTSLSKKVYQSGKKSSNWNEKSHSDHVATPELSDSESTPKSRPTSPVVKRTPLAKKFPFDQCMEPTLRETRHSVEMPIRQFVQSKSSISFLGSLRNCLSESPYPLLADVKTQKHDVGLKSAQTRYGEKSYQKVQNKNAPSILIQKRTESDARRVLVTKLNDCFHRHFAGRWSMGLKDNSLQDLVNFTTNLFIQEFSAAGTMELCSQIVHSAESGDLLAGLSRLIDEAEEKSIESGVDDFMDLVRERTTAFADGMTYSCKTEDLNIYESFKRIWVLNPHKFFEHSLDMLFTFSADGKDHVFTNTSFTQRIANDMEETAVKMNMCRFYYAYKRELSSKTYYPPNSSTGLEALQSSLKNAAVSSSTNLNEKARGESRKTYKGSMRVRFPDSLIDASA